MNDTPLPPINIFLKSSSYTSQIGTSHYVFELNEPVKCNSLMNIFMNLDTFQFTNCFYTITEFNNIFCYQFESDSSPSIVTIPHGFYNVPSLAVYLDGVIGPLSFSYSALTYKYTITGTSPFRIVNIENNCYEQLGVLPFDTYTTSKVADNLFNMMNVQQLKICVNNINLASNTIKNEVNQNILYALRVVVGPGEIQNFYNSSDFKYQLQDEVISSLEIYIRDQNNRPVNFNGVEFFMNITFTFQYKKILLQPQKLIDDYRKDTAIEYLEEIEKVREKTLTDEFIESL